jgi:hypothetical protein
MYVLIHIGTHLLKSLIYFVYFFLWLDNDIKAKVVLNVGFEAFCSCRFDFGFISQPLSFWEGLRAFNMFLSMNFM